MRILTHAPVDAEFVPIAEFEASAPASFALEESPLLILKKNGRFDGAFNGAGELRIASDALYAWVPLTGQGAMIPYSEITLSALQSSPDRCLFVQLESDIEFRFYCGSPEAVQLAIERSTDNVINEFHDNGYSVEDHPLGIDGEADDLGITDSLESAGEAGASVAVPTLLTRKRRRSS